MPVKFEAFGSVFDKVHNVMPVEYRTIATVTTNDDDL
jgi:hypothetical protein